MSMGISSDDSNLINECISGKREAWDTFVSRFSKLIYHSIHKTLHSYSCALNQEDTEDVFNSIFLSFIENNYKKLRQFRGTRGCTLSSWVRLLTVRQTIDFLRQQKNNVACNSDTDFCLPFIRTLTDSTPSPADFMELAETEDILRTTIDSLPSSDRLFMKLYYEKELPAEKIAKIMNVSINTIYSKKNRTREKIVASLKSRGLIARN